MLGYHIRKFATMAVLVYFKDGFTASGYLYSMNTVELPIVRFRGWWVLKNQVGSERSRFHSNEVRKVEAVDLMKLNGIRIELSVGSSQFISQAEAVQQALGDTVLSVTGKAEVKDGIVQNVEVDNLEVHEVDASHVGNHITASTEDVLDLKVDKVNPSINAGEHPSDQR